jgi:CBS domain-containing protein
VRGRRRRRRDGRVHARVRAAGADDDLVDDAYWHRGLPAALIARLAAAAACFGISTFLVRVGGADLRLLALLRETFAARWTVEGSIVNVEMSTAEAGSGWSTDPGERSARMAGGAAASMLPCMSNSAPAFDTACVADVMRSPVITCGPETPVASVAQMMSEDHVHAVVVTGIEGTAWGVVTALDLALAGVDGADAARDVAATEAALVAADAPLAEAARMMVEHQVDHLLVAGADGRPAGVVSTTDVARSLVASA